MDALVENDPRPAVDVASAEVMARDVYDIEGAATDLPGDRDRTFLIDTGTRKVVLRVESRIADPDVLATQASAIDHALSIDATLPVAGVLRTAVGDLIGLHSGYRLLVTEHLEGVPARQQSATPGFRRNLGRLTARLDAALFAFEAPVLDRKFAWNLTQLANLRPFLELHDEHRGMIEAELDQFETVTRPGLDRLGRQAIHGDLNPDNVLVDPNDPELIVGLFDFGDLCLGPAIVDLAIAIAYQCTDADPTEVMVQMAVAHHVERPLTGAEVTILPDLVAARCAQSLLMSAHRLETTPDNADYITGDIEDMARTLLGFGGTKREESVEALMQACGLQGARGTRTEAANMRKAHMAASYRLSYPDPVHASSAKGVWITEFDGRRLLDAYNNVPHVGHGHPQVLSALWSQSRRLNTNTRYLTNEVGEYAQRLAGLFPDPLSVVFFTNSGSEANDLAYRLAVTYTGADRAITTPNAYHGATTVAAALSPEEHDVATLGEWSVSADLLSHFGGQNPKLTLEIDGPIAMVIVDTIFSTEGVHVSESEMLTSLKTWVNDRGGLLVADEVQAGFGRVGRRFWGFGDVTPDIVTLGKPIGNGYPMGAVVTTPEIADRFSNASTFFSTFAGSPVAAAVGGAVLDVIESEQLADHSEDVGGYIRRGVVGLDHRSVVAVRGAGLFTGVELDTQTTASRVVDDMRHRGVLIGRTGPRGRVLKIRPPLVFQRHHADLLLEQLAETLE